MERRIEQELDALKELVLVMAGEVERQFALAMRALVERDDDAARAVIAGDSTIDQREVDVDQRIIELIVRERPLARDLRLVVTAGKIAPDLERIADHAVNICEQVLRLNRVPPLKRFVILPRMGETAASMVHDAIAAFVASDAALARQVIDRDDEVDAMHEDVFRELLTYMMGDPSTIQRALSLLMVARSLERMADQATNISEQVVYLAEGQDIRHAHGEGEA